MVGAAVSAVSGVVLVAIITNGFPKELAGTLFAATSAFLIHQRDQLSRQPTPAWCGCSLSNCRSGAPPT